MFGIGMPELLVILGLALIILGPKKLPEIARSLGKAMREFRRATTDLREQFEEETKELKDVTDTIREEVSLEDEGEFGLEDIEEILRHPENYCANGRPDSIPPGMGDLDIIPPVLPQLSELVGRRIDTGGNPVFWYTEWDCHLGDYLNHHVRVIDRKTNGPPNNFYDHVLQHYQSLVQRIR